MLSPKGWIAIALLIVSIGLYGAHRAIVSTEVSKAVATAVAKANEQARKTEDELRLNADALKKDKDGKIANLTRERDAAIVSLSNRPKRTDPPATSGSSCTGRELYREDAEFLTREAYRAQALVEERDYYYNLYEDTRKKLNGR